MKVVTKRRLRSKARARFYLPRTLRFLFWIGPKLVPLVRLMIEVGRVFRN